MKRGLWSFISICTMMIMTAQPVMAGTMYATEELNVRTLPGYDGEIVDVLEAGEPVEALMAIERERSWTIIKHEDTLKAVCTDYLTEEEPAPPEPATHLYGNCRITFYCACESCCGSWGNATASGVMPTPGRTVANGSLPFGTRVVIDGLEYVVEDRGVGSDQFDIFVSSHQEALGRGLYYADVYIVD